MPSRAIQNAVFSADDGSPVRLGRELGRGGEAAIFEAGFSFGYVAKIYHGDDPAKHAAILKEKEPKVRAMLASPPRLQGKFSAIAWPAGALRHNGRFVGFLMPRVEGKILFCYHNPMERRKHSPNFDWRYLHRTAQNLAAIVEAIHQAGHVIADVNDQNFLVQATTLVSAVDTDSFQIRDSGGRWHMCGVGRAEFTPPELQGKAFARHERGPEQDRFGLGVLIFQLVMEGSHPFRAKLNLAHSVPEAQLYCIRKGLFPHDRKTDSPAQPPPHGLDFQCLDPVIRNLFRRCFVQGHADPASRPAAWEWREGLKEAETKLTECEQGHKHYQGLPACPWCHRSRGLRFAQAREAAARVRIVPGWRVAAGPQSLPAKTRFSPSYRPPLGTTASPSGRQSSAGPVLPSLRRSKPQWKDIAGGLLYFSLGLLMYFCNKASTPEHTNHWRNSVTELASASDSTEDRTEGGQGVGQGGTISPEAAANVHAPPPVVPSKDLRTFRQAGRMLFHEDVVNSAAFSPDGRWVVTASRDNTAQVWDAATGQPIGQPLGHQDSVNCASFSPDGQWVVTASRDKTARVWEAATGRAIGQPLRHEDDVNSALFSPDGRWVVTASRDNTAQVWDAATGRPVGRPLQHKDRVNGASFSPDGRWVVTASRDNTARVWEAATGRPVGIPLQHDGTVNGASFSPDGRWVVTASADHSARVWEAATGQLVAQPLQQEVGVNSANYSSDGRWVVTTSGGQSAQIWTAPEEMIPKLR